jgi:hypothetical protein
LSPAIEQRLSALERAAAPALPSEQALANWSMQAARVALTHQEMAALADQTVATVEATATAAQSRLSELDAQQAALLERVTTAVTDAQGAITTAIDDLQQQGTTALSQLETTALQTAADIASQQTGPQGYAGSSVTVAMEDPSATDATSWAQRWYGRPELVPGDSALVPTPTALRVFRYTGSQWLEGPAIEPRVEMVNAQISSLDASTRIYPTVSTAVGGGSGGSGIVVPIAPSVITKNGTAPFVDTSRFQAGGFDSFTSGIIMLELTSTTGIFAGNRSSLVGAFQLLAGAPDPFRYTEFASLGNLFTGTPPLVDVQFNGQLGPATAPGGLGISIPPGSKPATTLFVSINSGEPSHTTFLLRGDVIFNQDPAGTAVAANALLPKQPAWQMV